ncbi:MAG: hypothetical protein E6Q68_03250 [Polynucleobacter sp.]|nr:MAG: hypothetical protein E6Q68_03250 [Polynucleobacter sp.]
MPTVIDIVTINTDASLCHENKLATFAFWIRSNQFLLRGAQQFKEYPNGSTHAEIRGIINAMEILLNEVKKNDYIIKYVVVNCDNIGVGKHIMHGEYKKDFQRFVNILDKPKVSFKHVKSHTNEHSARSYVNRRLDTEARNLLRNLRSKKQKQ